MFAYCPKPILQMAAASNLLLIVSLWFIVLNSVGVDSAGLPKPSLILDPHSGIFLPGEDYSLICHFPLTRCNVELYKDFKVRVLSLNDANYTAIFRFSAISSSKGHNTYTCKYQKFYENNMTWSYSPISEPVLFSVMDELPKPTISIVPASGVLSVGEKVYINCTSNYPSDVAHLYQDQGPAIYTRNMSDTERTVIFTIKELAPNDGGAFSCTFLKTVKGKKYESPHSNIVTFNVTEVLPRASISVEPHTGVVTKGKPIRLTCTGAILPSGGRFYFYRDGEKKGTLDVSGAVHAASFIVNDMVFAGSWNYTCGYARIVKHIAYHSPRSTAVYVTVTEFNGTPNSFPNLVCLAAIAFLWILLIRGIQ